MDRETKLENQVGELTRLVTEMRARLSTLEGTASVPHAAVGDAPRSRRDLLKLGGVAALGAVGAVALRSTPASAATNGNFILGVANLAENPTTIAADGGAPPAQVLAAQASSFNPATLAATNTPSGLNPFSGALQGLGGSGAVEGVDGWASGPSSFGVYGFTDSGTGVVGESATGIGLWARRSGRIRQDPRPAGAPIYSPTSPEQVRDANHVLWLSTPSGGWKQAATSELRLFPNPRRVYDGYVQPTAAGTYGPIDATAQVSTSSWPGGSSGVPAGAQAAYCAVQSYNLGVMTLYPDLTADPGIANWSGTANGPLNLLYVFVPLSAAGRFLIHTYFSGQKFIDVWGYLM